MRIAITLWGLSMVSLGAEGVSRYTGGAQWTDITALGCCLSLLVFLITNFLPKLWRENAKEIRDARTQYLAMAEKARTEYAESAEKARTEYVSTMDRMADRFERREKERDEVLQDLAAKLHEMHLNCARQGIQDAA